MSALDSDPPVVDLVEITAHNWRDVAAVAPRKDQERFVAPVTYYLSLCSYGGEWHPLAIAADGSIVGHVMWAVDPEDGSRWIGGLIVDAGHQRRGIGRVAVDMLITLLAHQLGCTGFALSYQADNTAARSLYAGLGFEETGETEGDEIVARLPVG